MKKWLIRVLALAALVALGIWAWRTFFPDPQRAIRQRLAELADLASFGSNESPAAKLWNAQKLGSFFTSDVVIKVNAAGAQGSIAGREDLTQRAAWVRQNLNGLSVQFFDIVVTVAPDKQSAIANLTARGKVAGEADFFGPQELQLRLKKISGDWLVSRVEMLKTLR